MKQWNNGQFAHKEDDNTTTRCRFVCVATENKHVNQYTRSTQPQTQQLAHNIMKNNHKKPGTFPGERSRFYEFFFRKTGNVPRGQFGAFGRIEFVNFLQPWWRETTVKKWLIFLSQFGAFWKYLISNFSSTMSHHGKEINYTFFIRNHFIRNRAPPEENRPKKRNEVLKKLFALQSVWFLNFQYFPRKLAKMRTCNAWNFGEEQGTHLQKISRNKFNLVWWMPRSSPKNMKLLRCILAENIEILRNFRRATWVLKVLIKKCIYLLLITFSLKSV
jgi:hypothetical protein